MKNSFSESRLLINSSQKPQFFIVLMYALYGHPDISSSSKNINSTVLFSRLSFHFSWLQLVSSSLDSLVKNLGKNDFNYLSQDFDNNVLDLVNNDNNVLDNNVFDNNVLDLVKQKGFYPYEYFYP